jgi:hypothetical protein
MKIEVSCKIMIAKPIKLAPLTALIAIPINPGAP